MDYKYKDWRLGLPFYIPVAKSTRTHIIVTEHTWGLPAAESRRRANIQIKANKVYSCDCGLYQLEADVKRVYIAMKSASNS